MSEQTQPNESPSTENEGITKSATEASYIRKDTNEPPAPPTPPLPPGYVNMAECPPTYLASLRQVYEQPDPVDDTIPPKITLMGITDDGDICRRELSLDDWRLLKRNRLDDPGNNRYPGYGLVLYGGSKHAPVVRLDVYLKDYQDRQTSPYADPEDAPKAVTMFVAPHGSVYISEKPLHVRVPTLRRLLTTFHSRQTPPELGATIMSGYVVDDMVSNSRGTTYTITAPPPR